MAYRSFIFSDTTINRSAIVLDARESHHLVRVFRARVGEAIEILDGNGRRYLGEIEIADAKAVKVALSEVVEVQPPKTRVTLIQSIPKGKTMDLILRMATEIGASTIQPVFTHQGDVQIKGERLLSKMDKWKMTMIEACKQCGLPHLPQLEKPQMLTDFLAATEYEESKLRIVASLEHGSRPLLEVLQSLRDVDSVEIAVGPEGDFTTEEYSALSANGFQPVRLGANVLRSETAAAYIMSVVDQCVL
ncbi:MAG: RsmE family RNA methyltransferase [Opitutaceae bacterium]